MSKYYLKTINELLAIFELDIDIVNNCIFPDNKMEKN